MNKPNKILFLLLLFLVSIKANAQSFLNGDFEINTAGADQINLTNGVFNSMMSNTVAFGTYNGGGAAGGDMDIITSATWGGSGAQSGLWYVALTGGGTDMFSMQLSSSLIAGNTYTISFYDRAEISFPTAPVEIGISTSDTAFGTSLFTGPIPTFNSWTQRTFTFVAPFTALYITVRDGGVLGNWVNVDNFVFPLNTNTITTGTILGSPFCPCSTISIPFTSSGAFTAGNIYTAEISDATGSFAAPVSLGTINSNGNIDTITGTLPCNLAAGAQYRIRVISSTPSVTGINNGVDITVSSAPAVTVNSPSICINDTANLAASGAATYTWSAGANSTGINTADAAPTITTSYTVTGTSAIGCTNTAVSTVTVNPLPIINVNSPNICTGQTALLTAGGAATYSWSAGVNSTGINTASISPAATATYTVTGTSAAGCIDSALFTVTVSTLPVITVNSPVICAGQTATLTASGAAAFTWSAGATASGATTATASPVNTTSYTVTETSSGCSATAAATITVNILPTAFVSGGGAVCQGTATQPVNIAFTGAGPWNFTYSDGTSSVSAAAASSPYVLNNPAAGNYTVTLVSDLYCTGTSAGNAAVTINPVPVASFTAPAAGCEPLCGTFTNTSSITSGSIATSNWNFGNGSTSSQLSPNICYTSPGTYSVSLTVTSNAGCASTVTSPSIISVFASPTASFSAIQNNSVDVSTIQFNDNSTGAVIWNWNFADPFASGNNTSTLQNPSHHYSQTGTYCSVLIVSSGNCYDTSEVCVTIEPEVTFYIPNSFSPNGDGINDEFYGKGSGVSAIKMDIWDRWGINVFHSEDMDKHWKGTYNDNLVSEDVYIYVITLTDVLMNEHKYKGTVTVIR